MSIKVLGWFSSAVIDRYFVFKGSRCLKVLPRQKYPMQTTAPATLIAASDLIKPFPAAAGANLKPHPVAVPVTPPSVLPIYGSGGGHVNMPRCKQSY
ncbi:MAG: hypothetical protein ACE5LA_01580 [Dehalococcoidales bacterium]